MDTDGHELISVCGLPRGTTLRGQIPLAVDGGPVQNRGMLRRKKMSLAEMRKWIDSFCGIFKLKPGEKSVVQELLEERRAERDRENRWEPKSKSTG